MRRALVLLAGLVGVALAAPAAAVTFTVDLDELEGAYATVPETKTQSVVFSTTELFRFQFMTLELDGQGDCAAAPCDPPPSFRFLIGSGVSTNLGPYPDVFSDTLPLALFRPILFLAGEPFELGLSLGRFPDGGGLLIPVPSAPTTLTRVEVTFTGDFISIPEPSLAGLALAGLAAAALARGRSRRR